MVVDSVNKAKKALENAGFKYTESDVLHVELPNVPGTLATFAGKLAAKGINVALGYQTSAKGAKKASAVLAVSDLEKEFRRC